MTNEIAVESNMNGEMPAENPTLEAMARAGVWYGRKKSKTNPRMKEYIYGTRNGIEIFDLPQTLVCLEKAATFLKGVVRDGGTILFVGTTPPVQELTRAAAVRLGFPFVTLRWLGGTLTNFKTLSTRIQYYLKLRADRDSGRLAKYTKKEQSGFSKEIQRLERLFGGLETMKDLPRAVVVAGAESHVITLRECKRLKIPAVAIANSDTNPLLVDYIIPANDKARSSVAWIMERLTSAIEEGVKERQAAAVVVPPQPQASK